MENNSIDIIIPNYNKSNYLEESINSVCEQTFQNWKLYLIDDCSKDNSRKIIDKFKNNRKIKILFLKKNKGPSFCRNLGIRISNSKLIAFLDSDDYWDKNKLELQIDLMTKNNYEFTFTDYISFKEKNGEKNYLKSTKIINKFNFDTFTKNSSINSSTMIVRRSIVGTLKFKKIKKLEDYLFKCELLNRSVDSAHKYDQATAYYRILNSSRSSRRLLNIFYLWEINKKFNKFNLVQNIKSLIGIIINSLKKYGFK